MGGTLTRKNHWVASRFRGGQVREAQSLGGIHGRAKWRDSRRTFRNERFSRILEGENEKTERMKSLTQVHRILNSRILAIGNSRGTSCENKGINMRSAKGLIFGNFPSAFGVVSF